MSTGELDERRRADDRERARLFGEEFRLGTLQRVSRSRDLSKSAGWGGMLGVIVFIVGLPVVGGVDGGPSPLAAKVIVAVVAGCLFAACCVLFGVGLARSPVKTRLFRYSGGLAQLVADEPEPRVASWADVRDFTVDYFESDDSAPRLTDFRLTTYAGTTVGGLRGYPHRGEVRAVVAEAELAYAAARQGVMLTGYRQEGGGIPGG